MVCVIYWCVSASFSSHPLDFLFVEWPYCSGSGWIRSARPNRLTPLSDKSLHVILFNSLSLGKWPYGWLHKVWHFTPLRLSTLCLIHAGIKAAVGSGTTTIGLAFSCQVFAQFAHLLRVLVGLSVDRHPCKVFKIRPRVGIPSFPGTAAARFFLGHRSEEEVIRQ
jgi:hypothetical protein